MIRRLEPMLGSLAVTLTASLLAAACSQPPAGERVDRPPDQPSDRPAASATTFVNRVWRVRESSSVAPGTLYVFLSEGTLVIASPHGKPALGQWKHSGDTLTLVEEGLPYRAEVLTLKRDELGVRVHNPGQPVEMTFVPADGPAPPLE